MFRAARNHHTKSSKKHQHCIHPNNNRQHEWEYCEFSRLADIISFQFFSKFFFFCQLKKKKQIILIFFFIFNLFLREKKRRRRSTVFFLFLYTIINLTNCHSIISQQHQKKERKKKETWSIYEDTYSGIIQITCSIRQQHHQQLSPQLTAIAVPLTV